MKTGAVLVQQERTKRIEMKNGYLIMVKDYKAEIVEFETLTVIMMPDESKTFFVQTKYGAGYYSERDLRATREELEQECEDMNKALQRVRG